MDSNLSENNALPFSTIIGAPFKAACDAQIMLAKSTADFIKEVGFVEVDSVTKETETRVIDFSFSRPAQDKYGNVVEEKVDLQVPMLAIVNVPNLSIKSVDVVFDMEIKSVESRTTSETTDDESNRTETTKKKATSSNIEIHGKVASYRENTRSTDNSAKYHIEVHAERDGVPEGLSRILDILATSIAPRKTEPQQIIQQPDTLSIVADITTTDTTTTPAPQNEDTNS